MFHVWFAVTLKLLIRFWWVWYKQEECCTNEHIVTNYTGNINFLLVNLPIVYKYKTQCSRWLHKHTMWRRHHLHFEVQATSQWCLDQPTAQCRCLQAAHYDTRPQFLKTQTADVDTSLLFLRAKYRTQNAKEPSDTTLRYTANVIDSAWNMLRHFVCSWNEQRC